MRTLTSGLEVGVASEWELQEDAISIVPDTLCTLSPFSAAFFSPQSCWVHGSEDS